MTKLAYQAPEMETIGSFEAITQSTTTGTILDAFASQGQPSTGVANLS